MQYILRTYQKESVQKGIDFFNDKKNKKNVIIVAPTGSGKSLIIANIAKELNGKTIVFQPSKELLEQNFAKYISYGEYAEIYSASMNRKKISHVTFATIGSVVKKPELFKDFDYCIVDECHLVSPDSNSMYQKFFSELNLKVLGLTATPIRMKRYNFPFPHAKICMIDRMKPRFFSSYLHITQISEMKNNNFFSDIDYFSFDFDNSILKINSTGGDYTEKSMSDAIIKSGTLDQIKGLYSSINKKGIIKHILIFIDSLINAEQLKIMLPSCEMVSSKTPKKEREQILTDFKNGKIKSVVNVGVLTTGFDFPELDCIISARPTMSLALYYQIIGRCVRPHKSKIKSYVFDFVGNFEKFGKVEDFVIEQKQGKWIIHNGNKILTNVDVSEENPINNEPVINFGKYNGQKLSEIPIDYIKWIYEKFDRNKYNEYIFKYFESNILVN